MIRTVYYIVLLLLVRSVIAALVNVTIDDQYGDPLTGFLPSYLPTDEWKQGANCSACSVRPDPAKAKMGTWHDATHLPNSSTKLSAINLRFNGELRFICARDLP